MRLLEIRVMRGCAALLLMIQALGGGAVALAHARDVVQAPPAVEATHDGCPILHDGPRCALCQYAGARVVAQDAVELLSPQPAPAPIVADRLAIDASSDIRRTPPSRAPPVFIS